MSTTTQPGLRLHVNWTLCDGRGLCTELLPELLDRDDWGYPIARDGSPEPRIPHRLADDAHTVVRLCPRLALTVRSPS